MHIPNIISRIICSTTFIGSVCITQLTGIAYAADFGSVLKGLAEAIQQNANEKIPADNGPSLDTQKKQANIEERARNSLKATKNPPVSANWTKIYYDEKRNNYYYDPRLIRQNGLFVTIPFLLDLTEPGQINLLTEGRYPYKSTILVVQYDCSKLDRGVNLWATEEQFFFPENMAKGEPMMDPFRSKTLKWYAGLYDGAGEIGKFIKNVLDPELKICATYWKRPEGWVAPKPPPYLQKTTAKCEGTNMNKWEECIGTTRRSSRPAFDPSKYTKDSVAFDQIFNDPGRYDGRFRYGIPSGWGTFTFEGGDREGDVYIGYFANGNFDGFGTYYHNAPNTLRGSIYSGYFKKHLKDGLGRYQYSDGHLAVEGIWRDGRLNKTVSLKDFFIDTRKGLPFCQGTDSTQWTDCFGYFEFESIFGQRLQQGGGRIVGYSGSFKDGLPDGFGSFFGGNNLISGLSTGVYYQGGLQQGIPEGAYVKFDSLNGESYTYGRIVNGKLQGKYVSQTDEYPRRRTEIDYVDGILGNGTISKEKEFTYVGGLKNGQYHGEGILTLERIPGQANPVVQQGIWENGKLLPPGKTLSPDNARRAPSGSGKK